MKRIEEKVPVAEGITFYVQVESNYDNPVEGKGQMDSVAFTMGQYTKEKHEIDSSVLLSVEDARAFAQAILKVCVEIAGV